MLNFNQLTNLLKKKAFRSFPDSNSDYISMYAMTFSKVLSKKAFKVKKKGRKVDEGCCDTIF